MKKYFFVLLVLSLFFISTVSAETTGDYLYLANYDAVSFIPEVIDTGDVVSMTVDIENMGTLIDIIDLEAELLLDDSLEGIKTTYTISEINAGSTKKLVFEFKVNENAQPGNYVSTLNLTYDRLGEEVFQQEEIIIPIIKTAKKVDIVVSPSVVSPGSKETLTFTITNLTNEPITNLSFTWDEANDLVLPLGSDNKRFVSFIGEKQSVEIEYVVAADPNIITGIYPLTATTTMNDNNGVTTQESTIGLIVGGTTDFEISVDTTESLLSINIANIGTNNAESVIVKILGEGISTKNNTEIVGNLDRGDYTIASFEITKITAKEATIEIDYTDTTGERQTITKTIQLNNTIENTGTRGNEAAGNFKGKTRQQLPITELVVLVGIVVVVVVGYKKRKFIRKKIKGVK
jgi:hypothetical protein